jgi:hypothetical protein
VDSASFHPKKLKKKKEIKVAGSFHKYLALSIAFSNMKSRFKYTHFQQATLCVWSQDSAVGIATGYGITEFESR